MVSTLGVREAGGGWTTGDRMAKTQVYSEDGRREEDVSLDSTETTSNWALVAEPFILSGLRLGVGISRLKESPPHYVSAVLTLVTKEADREKLL